MITLVASQTDTSSTEETSGSCRCPSIRTPVCGANGRAYDNKCKCECEGVDMECEGECNCIRDPRFFGISLDFSLQKAKTRTASWQDSDWRRNSRPCGCEWNYDPVCGRNGRTYDNACMADCDGVRVECWDECRFCDWDRDWDREDCVCPANWDPVCGEDGWSSRGRRTYGNSCLLRCDGAQLVFNG